jgi:hypothetical protein
LKTHPKQRSITLVEGPSGLGKDALLTELKYEAELREIEVIQPGETPSRAPAIIFLKTENIPELLKNKKISSLAQKASLIIAVPPESQKEIHGQLPHKPEQILNLRPLTVTETENYLTEVTRNPIIPQRFLQALYRLTAGYPRQLNEALSNILKDPDIVDASGRWQLAMFREVEPSLEQMGLSESALEQAGGWITDPHQRWEVQLKRATMLANQGKAELAFQILKGLETNVS